MNLRDLHYIVAVADLRNFNQAAERCCISQPTLSMQIKKLEEFLGVMIFERNNKRVMLTEVGEELVRVARRIVQDEKHLREIAALAQDPFAGRFRFGAFPTLASYLFPRIVPTILERFPRLRLLLVEEKTEVLLDELRHGDLDAALIALPVAEDWLVTVPLLEDRFYLAVAAHHPWAERASVTTDELYGQHLLLLSEGHCLRDQALAVCAYMGAEEEPDFRATSLETLRLMIKSGHWITLIPEIAIAREPDTELRYIPFADPAPSRTIALGWRKTSTRAALLEALAKLLEQI